MATTTSPNMGPRIIKTSNTPLYWGVALLAAVVIALALLMKPHRAMAPTSPDIADTAQALHIAPPVNSRQQVDPATGRVYPVNPETGAMMQNENPAYDANRVPSTPSQADVNPVSTPPKTQPAQY